MDFYNFIPRQRVYMYFTGDASSPFRTSDEFCNKIVVGTHFLAFWHLFGKPLPPLPSFLVVWVWLSPTPWFRNGHMTWGRPTMPRTFIQTVRKETLFLLGLISWWDANLDCRGCVTMWGEPAWEASQPKGKQGRFVMCSCQHLDLAIPEAILTSWAFQWCGLVFFFFFQCLSHCELDVKNL